MRRVVLVAVVVVVIVAAVYMGTASAAGGVEGQPKPPPLPVGPEYQPQPEKTGTLIINGEAVQVHRPAETPLLGYIRGASGNVFRQEPVVVPGLVKTATLKPGFISSVLR